jgi:cellulose synthase operon protein C
MKPFISIPFILLLLAACDSPADRADAHYNRGVELAAAGEHERAELEFRNALQADMNHVLAQEAYARLLRERGDMAGARAQYARLVLIDDENTAAHLALAEFALESDDMPAFVESIERAYELAPGDSAVQGLQATAEFYFGERDVGVEMAQAVLVETPDNVPAQMVLIGDRLSEGDYADVLQRTEEALKVAPDSLDLYLARLRALEALGESAQIGELLKVIVAEFPQESSALQALLQWQFAHGEEDEAIQLLRARVPETEDPTEAALGIVQVILELRGPENARGEIADLIEREPDNTAFRRAMAQLEFAMGNRSDAITSLQELVASAESVESREELEVSLAQMLEAVGRPDEAREIVDAVLANNDRHVSALKMRARWLIDTDMTERALADLQVASVEAPRDPEVMTLMAAAHEREGAHPLAGERLSRALEASNGGLPEALRYARFLIEHHRLVDAEGVVLDALLRAPNDVDLLSALGQIHLLREDYSRVRQVAGLLRETGNDNAVLFSYSLEATALERQGDRDALIAKLESLVVSNGGSASARIGLAQTHLRHGDLDAADAVIEQMLAADPESSDGLLLRADVQRARNQIEDAEATLRQVIDAAPPAAPAYQRLAALFDAQGARGEALAVLDAGLEATERDGRILYQKAGVLLQSGDFEGALAAYEELYRVDTSNDLVANNLASLLSTFRDDAESLERAFRIGRRFRGTDDAAFQDTYGWILVRRGDFDEALTYLEPAAAALAEEPLVQYHLGMAYLGAERWDEAKERLELAIDLAGADSTLPQIAAAEEALSEIDGMRRNAVPDAVESN